MLLLITSVRHRCVFEATAKAQATAPRVKGAARLGILLRTLLLLLLLLQLMRMITSTYDRPYASCFTYVLFGFWVCTAPSHPELCPTAVGSRCSAVFDAGNLLGASHCCISNSLTDTTKSSPARTWVVHPIGVTDSCTEVMGTGASLGTSSSHGWQNPFLQISSMLTTTQHCRRSNRFAYDPRMCRELFAAVAVVGLRIRDPMHAACAKHQTFASRLNDNNTVMAGQADPVVVRVCYWRTFEPPRDKRTPRAPCDPGKCWSYTGGCLSTCQTICKPFAPNCLTRSCCTVAVVSLKMRAVCAKQHSFASSLNDIETLKSGSEGQREGRREGRREEKNWKEHHFPALFCSDFLPMSNFQVATTSFQVGIRPRPGAYWPQFANWIAACTMQTAAVQPQMAPV